MSKVTLATDWLDACAGCHMSFLDIDERILEVLKHVQITSSPITDLKHPPESGVDVGILTGAVGNTEQVEVTEQMRKRCSTLIAMGDCAVFGGICAMRNLFGASQTLKRAYIDAESVDDVKRLPVSEELGRLLEKSKAVHEVVDVDVYIPGCPPSADTIYHALTELLAGRSPVLTGENLRYD